MLPDRLAPAYVVSATDTEQQIVDRAREALSTCHWQLGACAAVWTAKHARGRTDADFGELIGLSGDQVYQRRRVWESFADVQGEYGNLKWSHFYAAVGWDDAAECLEWANKLKATVAEMKAWRRSVHGEDLRTPAEEEAHPVACDGESRESERAPERVNRNAARPTRGGESRSKGTTRGPAQAASPTVPAGKKRAKASPAPSTAQPDHSPDAGTKVSPDRALSASEVIVRLRELLRAAEKSLDPDALAEIGDECRGWSNRLAPAVEDSGKFKAPRNESERLAFVEQVRAYCLERQNGIEPEEFVDAHAKQGWRLSNGNPLKDWKAAIRTWERMRKAGIGPGPQRGSVAAANDKASQRREQMDRVSKQFQGDNQEVPF